MAVNGVIIFLLLRVLMIIGDCRSQIMAQQAYSQDYSDDCVNFHEESSGYLCNGAAKECQTFVLYRAQQFYMSLDTIGGLFNTSPVTIAFASNLSVSNYSESLNKDQAVLFPIDCKCAGKFSQANLIYTVKDNETYLEIANRTMEGLTTCQAMREQNPNVGVDELDAGTQLVAPLRCACPTHQQQGQGIKYLLSYVTDFKDNDEIIPAKFHISHRDFISANELEESNPTLYPSTTLLIPLDRIPTVPPAGPFAPPPPLRLPPSPPLALNSGPPRPSSNPPTFVVIVGTSLAAPLLVLAGLVISLLLWLKRRKRRKVLKEAELKRLQAAKTNKELLLMFSELSDLLESDRLIHYSFKELQDSTGNFSEESRIEGSVFRGLLRGKKVAMKQMKGEVSKETNMLHKLHHTNLVILLGICLSHDDEQQHAYLVFEYAENGSLSNWIEEAGPRNSLPWKQRLQIAVDIAKGLEYLHHGSNPPCVHKDIKTSNILLDHNFRAKIANFGLAKSGAGVASLTSCIIGTQGYMAPEYLRDGLVTTKLDVFAFGVIVLQILSGRMAVETWRLGNGEKLLSDEIRDLLQGENPKGKLSDWMDPNLQESSDLEVAFRIAFIAKSCVEKDLTIRPSMAAIRVELSALAGISTDSSLSSLTTTALSSDFQPR